MSESLQPIVLSVRSFSSIEPIDGGDTIVVRFETPDGREIALLVPQAAASNLKELLTQVHEKLAPQGST